MGMRRMISKRIISSAKFLQMPLEAQALYFHLTINADDDGVAEAYPVTKLLGTAPDVIKILLAKNFIRQLNEDQVVLINNWTEHNTIRADRKIDSIYKNLLPENMKFIEAKPRSDVKDNSKRIGGQSTDGISKDKLSQVKLNKPCVSFEKFWSIYPKKVSKKKALEVWNKIKPNNNLLEVILKAIKVAKKTDQWERGFIPHPTTYLNQERWNDEFSKDDLNNDLLVIK